MNTQRDTLICVTLCSFDSKRETEAKGVFEATADLRLSLFRRPLPVHQTDGLLEDSLFP